MQYQHLITELEAGILTVTLNRPKVNALNQALLKELRQLFEQDILEIDGLIGVILTGAGDRAFVAGADISEFTSLDAQLGLEMAKNGHEIFALIEQFHRPVIAAVNGYALGGGCELAMACHLRVASEKALFGQPEVNLGIIPGYGGTQRLVQYIGKAKALELLMTGDNIDAQTAAQLGLVNYVVPAGEEVGKAKELLQKIGSKAPIAISKVIACVNAYYQDGEDGFEREISEFAKTVATEDFKEGATAFLEKRTANFKGQ